MRGHRQVFVFLGVIGFLMFAVSSALALTPTPAPTVGPTRTPTPVPRGSDPITFSCTMDIVLNTTGELPPTFSHPRQRVCSGVLRFKSNSSSAIYDRVVSCGVGKTAKSCAKQVSLSSLGVPPDTYISHVRTASMLDKADECHGCTEAFNTPKANIVYSPGGTATGVLIEHHYQCMKSPTAELTACTTLTGVTN